MIGYIYLTTNLVNNKIYVGQHRSAVFDKYYFGSGILITKALKVYGRKNFTVKILKECESNKDLDDWEIYYINLYNSTSRDIGYNISYGGFGKNVATETKTKISETLKSKHSHCYNNGELNLYFDENELIPDGFVRGRLLVNTAWDTWRSNIQNSSPKQRANRSDATKAKLSKAHIGEKVYNNGLTEIRLKATEQIPEGFVPGQIQTDARKLTLKKMKQASLAAQKAMSEDERKYRYGKQNIGKTPTNALKVHCDTTDVWYDSVAAAAKAYSISTYLILKSIRQNCDVEDASGNILHFSL